jgi:hypothetical protein
MKTEDRKAFAQTLIYGAGVLGAAWALCIAYLLLAGTAMIPIYWFMLGLGAASIAGVGAAGWVIGRGLPGSAVRFTLTFTPERVLHAGFASLLLAGTGAVTASGLGVWGWFWAGLVLAGGFSGLVLLSRESQEEA